MDICILHTYIDIAQDPCRIPGHDGVRWNIFVPLAAGAHDGVFTDADIAQKRGARADGRPFSNDCRLHLPIRFRLKSLHQR